MKHIKLLLLLAVFILLVGCESQSLNLPEEKYNLSRVANKSDSIVGMTQAVNDEFMFGYFGLEILIAFWIIGFISFFKGTGDGVKAAAAASYIGFLISLFLLGMKILSPIFIFVMLIMAGLFTLLIRD